MKVFRPDGILLLEGRLGPDNMYVYKMPVPRPKIKIKDIARAVDDLLEARADHGNPQSELTALKGEITTSADSSLRWVDTSTALDTEIEDAATPSEQVEKAFRVNSSVQHRVEHFNRGTILRGADAHEFHKKVGHPSDAVLVPALDSGCYVGTDLTSADLRVARLTL